MSSALPLFIFCSYLLVMGAEYLLRTVNLRHLRSHCDEVPAGFAGSVDKATLARTSAYTLEQSRVGLVESVVDSAVLLLVLYGGGLGLYDRWIGSLSGSFVAAGVLFFSVLTVLRTLLAIPFDLYRTFRVENRYDFNTTTPRLWIADFLKSSTISLILVVLLSAGGFSLVEHAPHSWWFWVWCFLAVISLFLIYLSPFVIEPLFFRFEPVQEPGLEADIRELLARAGLRVGRVLQVDASRRSRHSNA